MWIYFVVSMDTKREREERENEIERKGTEHVADIPENLMCHYQWPKMVCSSKMHRP